MQFESIFQGLKALHLFCINNEQQFMHNKLLIILYRIIKFFKKMFIILNALNKCLKKQELLEDINKL